MRSLWPSPWKQQRIFSNCVFLGRKARMRLFIRQSDQSIGTTQQMHYEMITAVRCSRIPSEQIIRWSRGSRIWSWYRIVTAEQEINSCHQLPPSASWCTLRLDRCASSHNSAKSSRRNKEEAALMRNWNPHPDWHRPVLRIALCEANMGKLKDAILACQSTMIFAVKQRYCIHNFW